MTLTCRPKKSRPPTRKLSNRGTANQKCSPAIPDERAIVRAYNAQRLAELMKRKIEYIHVDEFEASEVTFGISANAISLPSTGEECQELTVRTRGLPSYLARLYDVPLLSLEEERALFRHFNLCKYQADQLRRKLTARNVTTDRLKQIEKLLAEAERVKFQLIRANLRLVVSIAKRFVDANNSFDDLVSDGNVSLMRAVEKFNYSLGNRFSTYATYAVRRNFYRTVIKSRQLRKRFVSDDETLRKTAASESLASLNELQLGGLRESFERMLGQLDERERAIVRQRFGFGDADPKTFRQLGDELGVCKERIRQIQARAMAKLKAMATREHLNRLVDDMPE